MGFIVSLKGLNSALGIVFSKGESGYCGNRRMTTHRPWDREKEQPKKDRNKAENKNLGKRRLSPKFISFICCCCCVRVKNRPDGCQWAWTRTQGGEDASVWVVCVVADYSFVLNCRISVSLSVMQFCFFFSSLMTMFNVNKHRVRKSASAFIHATRVGRVMF